MSSNDKNIVDLIVEMNDTLRNNPMLETIAKLVLLKRQKRNEARNKELSNSEVEQINKIAPLGVPASVVSTPTSAVVAPGTPTPPGGPPAGPPGGTSVVTTIPSATSVTLAGTPSGTHSGPTIPGGPPTTAPPRPLYVRPRPLYVRPPVARSVVTATPASVSPGGPPGVTPVVTARPPGGTVTLLANYVKFFSNKPTTTINSANLIINCDTSNASYLQKYIIELYFFRTGNIDRTIDINVLQTEIDDDKYKITLKRETGKDTLNIQFFKLNPNTEYYILISAKDISNSVIKYFDGSTEYNSCQILFKTFALPPPPPLRTSRYRPRGGGSLNTDPYYQKYLKYKTKYLNLKTEQ